MFMIIIFQSLGIFPVMKKQRYQEKYKSYEKNKNGHRNYRNGGGKNTNDYHIDSPYYEDYNGHKSKYHRLLKMHQDLLQRKHQYESTLNDYKQKQNQLQKTKNKIDVIEQFHNSSNEESIIGFLRKKIDEAQKQFVCLKQENQEMERKLLQEKQRLMGLIYQEEANHKENLKRNQKAKYLEELELLLSKMKVELCELEKSDEQPQNEVNKVKQLIQRKRNNCLELKGIKQKTKESIKKFKKKRFEISQQMSKQERISQDLVLDIDDLNEKIKIEAQFDEKLRIENLKKMEEKQAKKLHPEDLPYEDLRKLKERNHELKLMILQVKQSYDKEKTKGEKLVSKKTVEEVDKKIQKTQKLIQWYQKTRKQNQKLVDDIKNIKEQKKIIENQKHGNLDSLNRDLDEEEEQLIQIKTTVKILRKEAEHLQTAYNQFMIERNKLETQSQKPDDSTKNQRQSSELGDFSEKDSQQTDIMRRTTTKLNKSASAIKQNKKKSKQIPRLHKNDQQYPEVYIIKEKKTKQLIFTWVYLCLLVLAAYYYNRVIVWFTVGV